MNWERIAGQWQQAKGTARVQWSRLTGNYAGVVAGLRERARGRARVMLAARQHADAQNLVDWRKRRHKADPIHK